MMTRLQFCGIVRLGLCLCLVCVVWLVVLPWIAAGPRMSAHLKWLDRRRVDPSAMYYTELEAMEPILRRLAQRGRGSPVHSGIREWSFTGIKTR